MLVPGAGGRGLMIQGRWYHHLPGPGGGIISCLGLGGGIIAQILTPNFSPQVDDPAMILVMSLNLIPNPFLTTEIISPADSMVKIV